MKLCVFKKTASCSFTLWTWLKEVTAHSNGQDITSYSLICLHVFTHILAYLSIFRYIEAYSDIIREIQELFRHIQAYLELCVNSAIFQNGGTFRTLVYSELWHIQTPSIHAFLYKQCQAEISSKPSKCKATPWDWTLALWKLFTFFIHVISSKIKGHILKNKQKNKCVYFHETCH